MQASPSSGDFSRLNDSVASKWPLCEICLWKCCGPYRNHANRLDIYHLNFVFRLWPQALLSPITTRESPKIYPASISQSACWTTCCAARKRTLLDAQAIVSSHMRRAFPLILPNKLTSNHKYIQVAKNNEWTSLNLHLLGSVSRTVKTLRRVGCWFDLSDLDLDQSERTTLQANFNGSKATPNRVASRPRFSTWVYLRVRLPRVQWNTVLICMGGFLQGSW